MTNKRAITMENSRYKTLEPVHYSKQHRVKLTADRLEQINNYTAQDFQNAISHFSPRFYDTRTDETGN